MGKRKIEITKIPDRQQRSVTFTKRRDGLFKKAETACQKFGGLQIGIVAFSPAGKPFTFCNSSSVSLDAIIDTYMSSGSSSSSSSVMMVMGKRRRPDEDGDARVIETEKKKKQKTILMNDDAVVTPPPPPPPPCIINTVQEEEEDDDEKLDHYKKLGSDQIYDQQLTSELMGYGENSEMVTGEMTTKSSQFLVEDETHSWAPPDVELQEIINLDDDDFEYDDHHHHHHHSDETTTMGLIPPHHNATTTSLCDLMTASDMNEEEEEVGGSNEDDDYGYTLEEWEHILSTSPTTSAVDNSTLSNSYMNQEVVQAHWPSQEFLQLLCS